MGNLHYNPNKIFDKEPNQEHYVYRYEPIEYFKGNIENKRLMFSPLNNWDDRLERRYLQLGKEQINKDAVGLCFTTNASENEAAAWVMHKKNSRKPFVQIQYDLDEIVNGLQLWTKTHKVEVFVESVAYKESFDHEKIAKELVPQKLDVASFADLLLLKRLAFKFEGEVRILIIADSFKLKNKLFEVALGDALKKACKRIRLEPFSAAKVRKEKTLPKPNEDAEILEMKKFVKQHIKTNVEVQRSRLYQYGPSYDIKRH